jgi:hypothetical protein
MGNQKWGEGQSKRDLAAGGGICVGIGDQVGFELILNNPRVLEFKMTVML